MIGVVGNAISLLIFALAPNLTVLFLARALSEQLGGELRLGPAEGGGAEARFIVRPRVARVG